MKLSRRDHLRALGSVSVGALTAAACGSDGEGAAAGAQPPARLAPAQADLTPFSVYFVGLHMFELGKARAKVSMPNAEQPRHDPYLLVLGGRLEAPADSGVIVGRGPFGIDAQATPLSGYALSVDSAAGSDSLEIANAEMPENGCGPDSADGWASMRYVLDIRKLYPEASLKTGWDGELAAATVTLTSGSLKALPGGPAFKARWGWRRKGTEQSEAPVHEQPMTGAAVWTFAAPGMVELAADPLAGAAPALQRKTIRIHRNTTGPLLTAVLYVPVGDNLLKEVGAHAHLTYNLFDDIPTDPAQYLYPERLTGIPCKAETPDAQELSARQRSMLLRALLQILNDGTPQCPPTTFWS